jgi:hypothetical protein
MSARAASAPASLVLKRSDVPAGYNQTFAKSETIQEASTGGQASVTTLRSKGWVAAYQTGFYRAATKTSTLTTVIGSGVTQFKSSSGAKWDLANVLRLLHKQYRGSKTFAVQGIGDQATGISVTVKSGKVAYNILYVVFGRGSYLGFAELGVSGGPASTANAEHYASIVDGRVKNA